MTTTQTPPRDYLIEYKEYDRQATHWLAEAELKASIDAGRECLWTAQVYATLAQAAATADLASRGIEVYPS